MVLSGLAGTVIPSESDLYVTPDIVSFRNRDESPKGGEGLFVVGPCSRFEGENIGLVDSQGLAIVEI